VLLGALPYKDMHKSQHFVFPVFRADVSQVTGKFCALLRDSPILIQVSVPFLR
jgi:hypothetical protein